MSVVRLLSSVFAIFALLPCWSAEANDADPELLATQVEIRRTEYGVPHILAENPAAAAFALAYVQSEDRFEAVMKSVIRGRGEMAKFFGGQDNVEYDLKVRRFRAHARARETFDRHSEEFQQVLKGFAAGINYYMRLHPEEARGWIETVSPQDVSAAMLALIMSFAFDQDDLSERFRAALNGRHVAVGDKRATDNRGSNTLALAPSRTTSGKAILLNNPHLPWIDETKFYEAHITIPGAYNFYGCTLTGGPMLTTGFNDHLGWSHTVNYPDLEEIYALKADEDHADHYIFEGESVAMWSEDSEVEVKGGDLVRETFWYTPLGPVIHRTATRIYVLRSVGFGQFRAGEQWYAMTKASNLEEFIEAQEMQAIAMFNIAYADDAGNIFYLWNGTIPDLPHARGAAEAHPATRWQDVWQRIHPIDDLPQLLNPAGGYVQNSNSPPYLTNLHQPLRRNAFPPHFPDNDLSLRTQHGLGLYHNEKKLSLVDVVAAKFSMTSTLAERLKGDLITAVEQSDDRVDLAEALEVLRAWDNTVSAESVGGVLFGEWWDRYSSHGKAFAEAWDRRAPMRTPRGLADTARAVRALGEAAAITKKRYGRYDVAWGEVHRLQMGDLELPVGGGGSDIGCYRVLGFEERPDGRRIVEGGDGFVFAVEFGATPRAYSVAGYSQSDRPESPHFNDQAPLFAANRMKRVAFTEEEIAQRLVRKYRPGAESAGR